MALLLCVYFLNNIYLYVLLLFFAYLYIESRFTLSAYVFIWYIYIINYHKALEDRHSKVFVFLISTFYRFYLFFFNSSFAFSYYSSN